MDRYIQSKKKEHRLFKQFECTDLIPYSIALILLLAEVYILVGFLNLHDNNAY